MYVRPTFISEEVNKFNFDAKIVDKERIYWCLPWFWNLFHLNKLKVLHKKSQYFLKTTKFNYDSSDLHHLFIHFLEATAVIGTNILLVVLINRLAFASDAVRVELKKK